jgi:DUF971 family protein
MTPSTTPRKLDLKKDEKLDIVWDDGRVSSYSLSLLRSMCPCAQCKEQREEKGKRVNPLRILPGNYAKPLTVESAELVGNYAIKLTWSDGHDTGIYSFQYLSDIAK